MEPSSEPSTKPSSDYLNYPVFISGYNKSGTTLFLSLLDNHPQLVVIPEELDFFENVLYEKDKANAIKEKTGFKMFLNKEDVPEWSQGKPGTQMDTRSLITSNLTKCSIRHCKITTTLKICCSRW